jgi:hypothetical protein
MTDAAWWQHGSIHRIYPRSFHLERCATARRSPASRPSNRRGRVLPSTHLDRAGETVERELALRGDEGVIFELAA